MAYVMFIFVIPFRVRIDQDIVKLKNLYFSTMGDAMQI